MTHDHLRRYMQRRDAQTIASCITACAAARDGRGRWRPEDRCARELAAPLEPSRIEIDCAAAAARIGAWLAGVGK